MLDQNNLDIIKETVKEFFQKITFEVEVNVLQKEETISIDINTEEPQVLIGETGQTMAEIQHLLKIVLRRRVLESFYINLDINNYKQKKYQHLKELAFSVADEVILTQKEKELTPMSADERRIIHLALSTRSDVITKSTGYGVERRVIVSPHHQD